MLVLAGLVVISALSSAKPLSSMDKRAVEDAIIRQMKNYPKSRLQDIYKNFFQDYFGPEHLIKDITAADKYLKSELASYEECSGVDAEPTGSRGNFYRVNLRVLKENRISYKEFFDAFIESAQKTEKQSIELWITEWDEILLVIDSMQLNLPDYEADKKRIQEVLSSGRYAMHHSDIYRNSYAPHYRIMKKDIYQRLKIKSGS